MFGSLTPYDINANWFLSQTEISDAATTSAINELVQNLKAGGVWNDLVAIYPFAGLTAGPQAVNLKTPGTYNLTFTGATATSWTHSADGVQGDGVNTTWIDTNFNENTFNDIGGTTADIHMSIQLDYVSSIYGDAMGVWVSGGTASEGTYISFNASDKFVGQARGLTDEEYTSTGTENNGGFYLVSRRPDAASILYHQYNGTGGTGSSANKGNCGSNRNIYIGARNDGGTSVNSAIYATISFATFGNGLTESQGVALYKSVQKFNERLGRPTT